ncbi:hypothetical protein ACFE04_008958 [Oxalis oulophora]
MTTLQKCAVIRLRRRQTLRMLLNQSPPPEKNGEKINVHRRQKLKDLFLSSPPPFDEKNVVGFVPETGRSGDDGERRGLLRRPSTFRYRLLRRAWRPVLVTIPEQ